MKSLIFSGLVLGSMAYLVATQTDWLQNLNTRDMLATKEKTIQLDKDLRPIQQPLRSAQDSELVQQLQASVSSLKKELAQLSKDLQEAKKPQLDAPAETVLMPVVPQESQVAAPLPRHQIEPESLPVSPYMPAAERSNALMDLVHRMEMKAAGY